jgi:ankyrin repeat protein
LHYAAWEGHVWCVFELLKRKADLNIQDMFGNTSLHLAAENGHVKIVKALVGAGANVSVKNGDLNTAQQVAADKGQFLVGNFLMEEARKQNPQMKTGMWM